MRRILLAAAMLAALLAAATPAEARHGHCGYGGYGGGWGGGYCGYGGFGGYRSCGYGGFGGYRSCGYGGWGGYGLGLSVGYCQPYYNYGYNYAPSYIYGGFNMPRYYYPTPIGYYGYYGSTYDPNSNFNGLALSNGNIATETTPAQVLNLLRLNQNDLLADLRERANPLPRIGGLQETTITAAKPALNQSNIAQRRKADQQIATGDMLFREQKFHAALQQYKDAARLAPDMAEPYWRQGHALIATANFELAGGAFKRALALDPNTSRDGFTLNKLYGPATIAKASHLEDLAAWALDHVASSEPYFLMGVTLHYDGQADRAAKFFARAAEMAGATGGHIAAFAPAVAPAAAQVVEHAQQPPVIRQPDPPQPPVAQPEPAQPVSALVEI
jgi:tetratricopeptide (TPR) repeat protein